MPVLRSGGRQLLVAHRPLQPHKWHSIRQFSTHLGNFVKNLFVSNQVVDIQGRCKAQCAGPGDYCEEMYFSDDISAKVVTGSGLVGEMSALELGRNFHGCMKGLAIGDHSIPHLTP